MKISKEDFENIRAYLHNQMDLERFLKEITAAAARYGDLEIKAIINHTKAMNTGLTGLDAIIKMLALTKLIEILEQVHSTTIPEQVQPRDPASMIE